MDDDDEDDDDDEYGQREGSPPEFSGGRGKRRRVEGPRIELLNFKDVSTLSRFITEQGKILPKRTTKVTARFQRDLGWR
jgi:small subunit ribosomal protein S18